MDREVLIAALLPLVSWPLVVLAGGWVASAVRLDDADAAGTERRAWQAVWLGMLPAVCAFAMLVGWAIVEQEPTDETVGPGHVALSVACALPLARALLRGAMALRHTEVGAAATVGIVRPEVVVDPGFASSVAPPILRAAVAHEQAHAAGRDPARLWLAQIATDLQWPAPGARARLETWRQALEWRRDDDARRAGVPGEDLAAAIVAAHRWQGARPPSGVALARSEALRVRIGRLLRPMPAHAADGNPPRWPLFAVGAAVLVGVVYGDALVRALVGAS